MDETVEVLIDDDVENRGLVGWDDPIAGATEGNTKVIRYRSHGGDMVNGNVAVGELALLAEAVYHDGYGGLPSYNGLGGFVSYDASDDQRTISGYHTGFWRVVKRWRHDGEFDLNVKKGTIYKVNGFGATLYEDDGDGNYVLAFRGTDGSSLLDDWPSDVNQASGSLTWQYYDAAKLVCEEVSQYLQGAKTLCFTGHSLGGGLAALASYIAPRIPTVTFNAAGLHDHSKQFSTLFRPIGNRWDDLRKAPFWDDKKVLHWNYHVAGEALTMAQTSLAPRLYQWMRNHETAAELLVILNCLRSHNPMTVLHAGTIVQNTANFLAGVPKSGALQQLIPGVEGVGTFRRHSINAAIAGLGLNRGPFSGKPLSTIFEWAW